MRQRKRHRQERHELHDEKRIVFLHKADGNNRTLTRRKKAEARRTERPGNPWGDDPSWRVKRVPLLSHGPQKRGLGV
jgi:hypothetical protein